MNIATTTTTSLTPTTITLPGAEVKLDKAHAGLKKASEGFESYFVNEMLKEMRKTIPKDDLMGDDSGEDIFQDMSDQSVADSEAKTGSFGIANMLYQQLSKGLPPNNPGAATSAASVVAEASGTPQTLAGAAALAKKSMSNYALDVSKDTMETPR